MSLKNIQNDYPRITAIFVLLIAFYTLMTFVLMHFYWKKSQSWRHREHSHNIKFLDNDIAMHAVMVSKLDKKVSVEKMQENLNTVFNKLFPGSKIIKSRVIAQFDTLYKIAVKLREAKKLYRYYRRVNKDNESTAILKGELKVKREEIKKRKGMLFSKSIKYDAEDYYREKIAALCEKIRKER